MDTVKNVEPEVRRHRLQYMYGPRGPGRAVVPHNLSCRHCCYIIR